MKQRLSTFLPLIQTLFMGMVLVVMVLADGQPAAAQGGGESYFQDQYYLGKGGTPPSLTAFAVSPRTYLRHEAAYQSLKRGFEQAVGITLHDEDFSQLLASDRVRLAPCNGSIETSAITSQGTVSWKIRGCYNHEHLIQVYVNGNWTTVASQGCANLVRRMMTTSVVPTPPKKVCRLVVVDEDLISTHTSTWRVPGQSIELCNCGETYDLPTTSGVIQRNIRSNRLVRVCE